VDLEVWLLYLSVSTGFLETLQYPLILHFRPPVWPDQNQASDSASWNLHGCRGCSQEALGSGWCNRVCLFSCHQYIQTDEAISLYRGMVPPLLGVTPMFAVSFWVHICSIHAASASLTTYATLRRTICRSSSFCQLRQTVQTRSYRLSRLPRRDSFRPFQPLS
jgi:hypothetical protein